MEKTITNQQSSSSSNNPKHVIWDCGSSLYDSFELKSFEKQLDAAIASRTLSMPRLSDRRRLPPPPLNTKPSSKISRSLHRLIRSVFRPKNTSSSDFGKNHSKEGIYGVYDRSGSLSTIPESPESDVLSPEIRSVVRRTASDRFTDIGSIGVY